MIPFFFFFGSMLDLKKFITTNVINSTSGCKWCEFINARLFHLFHCNHEAGWVYWWSYRCNLTIFACYSLLSLCSVCMLRVMFIQSPPNFRRVNILYSYIWGVWVFQHYLFDGLQDCGDCFPHASFFLKYNSLPKVLSSFGPWDMRLSGLEC